MGDIDKALDLWSRTANIQAEIGNEKGRARTLNNVAQAHEKKGDIIYALDTYFEILKIQKSFDDFVFVGHSYNNIASIYGRLGEKDKSTEYSELALKYYTKAKDKQGMARANLHLASKKIKEGNLEEGFKSIRESERLYKELGDISGLASVYNTLAMNHENSDTSLHYYMKSLEFLEKTNDLSMESSVRTNIANNLFQSSSPTALEFGLKGLEQARKIGDPNLISSSASICSKIYAKNQQWKKAHELLLLSVEMGKKIRNDNIKNEVIRSQYRYQYEQKAMTDSLLQVESSLQNELVYQAKFNEKDRTRNLLIGSGLLLLILAGGLWGRVRYVRKTNAKLEIERNRAEKEKDRAERSEAFKQEFLANMSHEIRTPMNAVLGMTSLALDNKLDEKVENYLSAVKKSSESLLVIINDILDLSKLEAGKMELEKIPFILEDQIQQVYDTLQFKAEEKGLEFKTNISKEVPRVLKGDP
jgi:tetratricopeptide (TPR) repeat protein